MAATAAQTGAETAAGRVTPVDPVPVLACELPAPVALFIPQLVLFEATPAHTGAETATGPVTLPPVEGAEPALTPVLVTGPAAAPWTTAVLSWLTVLAVTLDPVETVAPACNWDVVEVTPTGEVELDGVPMDVPSARAAAP